MRIRPLLTIALALAAAVGCERSSSIAFDKFVDANVELRKLSVQATSPGEFAARKKVLLAKLGVTEAELDAYVQAHAGDVKAMSEAWDSVEVRLGRATRPDTASHASPPGARVGPPAGGGSAPAGRAPAPGVPASAGRAPAAVPGHAAGPRPGKRP